MKRYTIDNDMDEKYLCRSRRILYSLLESFCNTADDCDTDSMPHCNKTTFDHKYN